MGVGKVVTLENLGGVGSYPALGEYFPCASPPKHTQPDILIYFKTERSSKTLDSATLHKAMGLDKK